VKEEILYGKLLGMMAVRFAKMQDIEFLNQKRREFTCKLNFCLAQ